MEVVNRAYRVEDAFIIGERITPQAVADALGSAGHCAIVVESNEASGKRLAGAVLIEIRGARGNFGPLAVSPGHQGRGIGRLLVDAAASHCRDRGCAHLDLDVLDFRPELVGIYERMGFLRNGTAAYPHPERLRRPAQLILMTKAL